MNIYAGRVAIVGVSGFAGAELARLLGGHSRISLCGQFDSSTFSPDALRASRPDVVVLATEHARSLELVPALLSDDYRVVDMSGAYRLKHATLYPDWYGFVHSSPELLSEAVYGLPEFFANRIRSARLVANPGCYATAAILPLRPLYQHGVIEPRSTVVVDGKSGVSGAGRKPKLETHFCEVTGNIRAYGVLGHRHTPEMVAVLPGATLDRFVFTPHLIPISRGILNTIVLRHRERSAVAAVLADTYGSTSYVKLFMGRMPDIHEVVRTNSCHIGIASRGDTTVLVSTMDNLGKGAAGQALQNLELMFGIES
jgi:N-acetyl-gamma-glutamyl-phosphate reductase